MDAKISYNGCTCITCIPKSCIQANGFLFISQRCINGKLKCLCLCEVLSICVLRICFHLSECWQLCLFSALCTVYVKKRMCVTGELWMDRC